MAKKKVDAKLQLWIDARKKFRLSHAHVQMARELGMNPKTLGKIANHRQERWKAPLPQFIEHLYVKRFGKHRPEVVLSIEQRARRQRVARERAAAARAAESGTGRPPFLAAAPGSDSGPTGNGAARLRAQGRRRRGYL